MCPTVHVNEHLSCLSYGGVATKGRSYVRTRNLRIKQPPYPSKKINMLILHQVPPSSPQVCEGSGYVPRSRKTHSDKTESDRSTANRCESQGFSEITKYKPVLCHRGYGTLNNPHCRMVLSPKYRSKYGVLRREWERLQMSEKLILDWNKWPHI